MAEIVSRAMIFVPIAAWITTFAVINNVYRLLS